MNIFDELGIKFSKDPQSQKDAETKKHIKASEEKRDALIDALKAEAVKLENDNNDFYRIIGELVFKNEDKLKEAGLYTPEVETAVENINKNLVSLTELEEKRKSVVARYDEEISILESALKKEEPVDKNFQSAPVEADAETDSEKIYCPECGALNSKDSNFCFKCGSKLN